MEAFHASHEQSYSRRFDGQVQLVNVHIEAIGLSSGLRYPPRKSLDSSLETTTLPEIEIVFAGAGGGPAWRLSTAYDRTSLLPGTQVSGPALIEQIDSTTIVPPGVSATVDEVGNLLLQAGDTADSTRSTLAPTFPRQADRPVQPQTRSTP
jgi:N-methylhydantoinase A/oxoprolinase/acetone carboxylase beta subunit